MKKWGVFAILFALGSLLISPVQAATVTFNLGTVFSDGSVAPDGPAPYTTVNLDDGGGTGTVIMTLDVSADIGVADLAQLNLNFDSPFDVTQLAFAFDAISSTGPAAAGFLARA